MATTKYIILLALLSTEACKEYHNFYGTDQYTHELLEEVVAAANKEAGCEWVHVNMLGDSLRIIASNADLKEIGGKLRGYTDFLAEEIVLETPTEFNRMSNFGILNHEIGHAIGLEHEGNGLMAPNYTVVDRATATKQLVAFAREHDKLRCK